MIEKIRKNLYRVLLLVISLFPLSVSAEMERSSYELEMYDILGGEDRKLTITSVSTLPAEYLDGSNGEKNEYGPAYDIEFSDVIKTYIDNLESIKNYRQKYNDKGLETSVFCVSYTNCGISFYDKKYEYIYDENEETEYPNPSFVHFDVDIKIEKLPNKEVYKYIGEKFPSFFSNDYETYRDNFYLFDLAYINQFLNLTSGISNFLNVGGGSENAELVFSEIKEAYEDMPGMELTYSRSSESGENLEDLEFEYGYGTKTGHYVTYYNNVAYGMSILAFNISPVIFVSDNIKNTNIAKIDAAEARIKEYIDDSSIKFTITDKNSDYSSEEKANINNKLSEFLKGAINKNISVSGDTIYELKIGNKTTKIFIVPVNDEIITTHEVKSFEKTTGIKITSKSADVPLDSSLRVEDVTDEYSDDDDIISAYDINLYSYYKDGYIKNTRSGTKVMIPVEDDFDEEGKSVYYIKSDGTKEKVDSKVETIDNKKYVTFTTNHFSVYAIAETNVNDKTDEEIKDPNEINTGDAFIYIVCIIGVGALGYSVYYFRKRND